LIEDSWVTQQWETHVFSFILAFTKVNPFLCIWFFTFSKGELPGCPSAYVLLPIGLADDEQQLDPGGRGKSSRGGYCVGYQLLTTPLHAKHYKNCKWI
jgi:hypothetical protein